MLENEGPEVLQQQLLCRSWGRGGRGGTLEVTVFKIGNLGRPVRFSGYPEWPFWANPRLVKPYISKANKVDTKIHPHINKWDKFRTKPKNSEN